MKPASGCLCKGAGCQCDERRAVPATSSRPPDGLARLAERNYEVQAFTGYPTSTVPAGQWNRGILYRGTMPALHLTGTGPMYDASDPAAWVQ